MQKSIEHEGIYYQSNSDDVFSDSEDGEEEEGEDGNKDEDEDGDKDEVEKQDEDEDEEEEEYEDEGEKEKCEDEDIQLVESFHSTDLSDTSILNSFPVNFENSCLQVSLLILEFQAHFCHWSNSDKLVTVWPIFVIPENMPKPV